MSYLLLPNQLFDIKYLDKTKHFILYEHPVFFSNKCRTTKFHINKLILHRASMRYYFDYLTTNNFNVTYVSFDDKLPDTIKELFHPHDKILEKQFKHCVIYDSPMFLHSLKDLQEYKDTKDILFHHIFKQWSINKLSLKGLDKSYDINNRNKIKDTSNIPQFNLKDSENSKYVLEAKTYIKQFKHYGYPNFIYPITHKDAFNLLTHFLQHKLSNFGKYQDAITTDDNLILYHSFLSSSLNIGLLTPQQVVNETVKYKSKVPIESYEGFLRQIVGWREYMRYIYIYHYDNLIKSNYFNNTRKLPLQWYDNSFKTDILPIDNCLEKVKKYGYLHHIERLMILLNYMTLCEYNPKDICKWFLSCVSIDAYDWVMKTNVYIFSYAWRLASRKPYISSSNYILKMSNYKKGEWSVKWDKLYKDFLKIKKDKLKGTIYYAQLKS